MERVEDGRNSISGNIVITIQGKREREGYCIK